MGKQDLGAVQGFPQWLEVRLDWSAYTMTINFKTPQLWEDRRKKGIKQRGQRKESLSPTAAD